MRPQQKYYGMHLVKSEAQELDNDEQIEALIDMAVGPKYIPVAAKRGQNLSDKERREVIRLLALGHSQKEVVERLNQKRPETHKLPDSFNIWYYQKEYAGVISAVSRQFRSKIEKAVRWTDKFVRLRQLHDLAEASIIHLTDADYTGTGDVQERRILREEYRKDVQLLLAIFQAIHKEMGVQKFVTHMHQQQVPEKTKTMSERWDEVAGQLAEPVDFDDNGQDEHLTP